MSPKKALEQAVQKAGSPTALAALIGGGVKRQHVEYWLKVGKTPATYCPAIERAVGVRCEDLDPTTEWSVLRKRAQASG